MKRLAATVLLAVAIGSTGTAFAAPAASTYNQFLQSMDLLTKEAVLPLADEVLPSSPVGTAQSVIAAARSLLGQPVVWGGSTPAQGFDCSGLVQYVFRQAGISLPRTADLQFLVGQPVAKSMLQPGDLVYFTTYAPGASHVGIYIGLGKFIHTAWSQGIVAIGDINDDYFVKRYYGAKRVI
ncbi:hypothetical protein SCACP_28130 [Sporomusa carbonis]|uniref:C40 family peptidase n=1 Tax=Sporomusa carbonis TaxID=3076075 RepID=UPI003A7590CC